VIELLRATGHAAKADQLEECFLANMRPETAIRGRQQLPE
jgi:hypothetical protein